MKKAKVAARGKRPAQVGTPAAPLLDTVENLILHQHLVPLRTFQALMRWTSPQAVTRALRADRIFAMELEGQPYFPVLFADPVYNRRHLAAVTKQLSGLTAGEKLQFFGSRKASLSGLTPLEVLATGRLETVLQLAAAYAES